MSDARPDIRNWLLVSSFVMLFAPVVNSSVLIWNDEFAVFAGRSCVFFGETGKPFKIKVS